MRFVSAFLFSALAFSAAHAQGARPAPPEFIPSAPIEDNACESAPVRDVLVQSFQSYAQQRLSYVRAYGAFGEALADWKGERMVERGLWSERDARQFAVHLLQDSQFMGYLERSFSLATAFEDTSEQYIEALARGDDFAACAAARNGSRAVDEVMQSVAAQWRYVHARYDAEARERSPAPD